MTVHSRALSGRQGAGFHTGLCTAWTDALELLSPCRISLHFSFSPFFGSLSISRVSPASFPTSTSERPSFIPPQPEDQPWRPLTTPFLKCSWTDTFLDQMRVVQQAEALAPADDPGPDAIQPHPNLEILQNRGGPRHWRFYRPHPLGPALSSMFDLRVSAATTIEDVHGQLQLRWPDLVPGIPSWTVEEIHPSALGAIEFADDCDLELYVVVADWDLT